MFRSARVKLTLFYLGILLVFSLSVTSMVRVLAEREYARSNDMQRSEVRHLLIRNFLGAPSPRPDSFYTFQDDQAALVREHLNQELVAINVAALVLGGILSYWFAGRTLKPIEQAHEAQARFASDASHELRTPLTNMRLENEVFLRQKDFTKDDARGLIKSNLEEVQRLEDLSANLLDLTRYGKTVLDVQPLAIEGIVNHAVGQSLKLARRKKATIIPQLAKGMIMGEEASLAQLLTIVLDNALKYGPQDGEVILQGRQDNGAYVLRVLDEGPGIDEADLPFIFDRLYRGDKARSSKTGGYGLGLALAREIARANGASIVALNRPEGGACFELHLALAETPRDARAA